MRFIIKNQNISILVIHNLEKNWCFFVDVIHSIVFRVSFFCLKNPQILVFPDGDPRRQFPEIWSQKEFAMIEKDVGDNMASFQFHDFSSTLLATHLTNKY